MKSEPQNIELQNIEPQKWRGKETRTAQCEAVE